MTKIGNNHGDDKQDNLETVIEIFMLLVPALLRQLRYSPYANL